MPKKRQIPFLFETPLADGTMVHDWKPSPRLRKAGFVNVRLGTDAGHAAARAIEINKQIAAWQAAGQEGAPDPAAAARQPPRIVRFDEAARRYLESDEFGALRPSTQAEYRSRLTGDRALAFWARDMPVRDITTELVVDLRKELVRGSVWRAAALLRVLRLFLAWCVDERIIASNPAEKIEIPTPPSRRHVLSHQLATRIEAAATTLEMPDVALAVALGFWSIQRQSDLLGLNRMAWRELRRVDPRHARWLAGSRGRIMGFQVQQEKTRAWIMAPTPPALHDRIADAMAANAGGWVFADPDHPADAMPDWKFQRRFRQARTRAAADLDNEIDALEQQPSPDAVAIEDARALRDAIAKCQFRDLRRSGMVFYRTAGANLSWITSLSGHAVLGKKSIVDTYMPADIPASCACVATGLSWLAEVEAAHKEGAEAQA
jgi:hypothetical protein